MWHVGGILFLTIAFSGVANSFQGYNFPNHKKGFWITPKHTPNLLTPLKAGDKKTFELDACIVKWGELNKKERCQMVPDHKLSFKAYFPDKAHEVTDKIIVLKSHDKKSWKVIFTTEELKSGDLNQFTFAIGDLHQRSERLLGIQAKLEKRIQIIEKIKSLYSNKYEKKPSLEFLNKLQISLKDIISRINLALDASPDILAEISLPLQVENDWAAPYYYASNFSGQKMAIGIDHGSPIDGESTKLTASVTNLGHLNFIFPKLFDEYQEDNESSEMDHKNSYNYSLYFNDALLTSESNLSLNFGETWKKEFILPKVMPTSTNDFSFVIEKNHQWFGFKYNRKWGSLYGDINVSEDQVNPEFAHTTPNPWPEYVQNLPSFSTILKDNFGRINSDTITLTGQGNLINGESLVINLINKILITKKLEGQSYLLEGDINPLPEGLWTITAEGADFAGNFAQNLVKTFRIDRTKPSIHLGVQDNYLTNNPLYTLPVTILDHSPVHVRILHNGNEIYQGEDPIFDFQVTLIEGINSFEVMAIDAAGNIGETAKLYNIELDTIPPILSEVSPADNSITYFLSFPVNGKSNEPLSSLKINGQEYPLANDRNFYQGMYTALTEGVLPLRIEATDLAGNTLVLNYETEIYLKVLNGDLISITPSLSGTKLLIVGMPYAARPGILVNIDAGFFNQTSVVANNNGSFEAELKLFSSVSIKATDPKINRTDIVNLQYNLDTTLSGIVKDIDDNPLPGVVVRIIGSNQTSTTDGTGTFSINDPATGLQTIEFDGTKVPVEISGVSKMYSRVAMTVNIGTIQQNVIENPIYLAPLMFDGTETEIIENSSVTVTSPHAPGVAIRIPAGVVTFPDGQASGVINMITVSKDRTSIAPLEFAIPDTVVALEPSGLQFNEPVELELPNVNNFPPNMQVVIL